VYIVRSYSWSANITGSKEWLLYPPKQEALLRDTLGNLPFDVTNDDLQGKIQCGKVPPPIKVVQQPGEIMFVPRYIFTDGIGKDFDFLQWLASSSTKPGVHHIH